VLKKDFSGAERLRRRGRRRCNVKHFYRCTQNNTQNTSYLQNLLTLLVLRINTALAIEVSIGNKQFKTELQCTRKRSRSLRAIVYASIVRFTGTRTIGRFYEHMPKDVCESSSFSFFDNAQIWGPAPQKFVA